MPKFIDDTVLPAGQQIEQRPFFDIQTCALGFTTDTPLAEWYSEVRAQRLVDEVHGWRVGSQAVKTFAKYGTTAPATGGDLF